MTAEQLFALIFVAIIYLLPGLIAYARQHHQAGAITVLSLVLGWTVIGWLVALVWASTAVKNDTQSVRGEAGSDRDADHRGATAHRRNGLSAQ